MLYDRPERFAGAHCREQVSGRVMLGEGQHAGQVTRWLVPRQPEDREYPGVVFIANQKQARGPTRCRG